PGAAAIVLAAVRAGARLLPGGDRRALHRGTDARGRHGRADPPRRPFPRLDQYVNDRPYVASSFLSVAIARVYNTALGGRSKERPELVEQPLPLRARIAAGFVTVRYPTSGPTCGASQLVVKTFDQIVQLSNQIAFTVNVPQVGVSFETAA